MSQTYDQRGEPYHYYPEGSDTPKLCEIFNGWVCMFDTERVRHISKFSGRFVKLVEACDVPVGGEAHGDD